MASVLITGASGYLGKRLLDAATAAGHAVIAISRKKPESKSAFEFVRGDFASFEDLRKLDKLKIDVVVHLAAETGGCSEEAGIETNIAGTRRLVRYLLDRGCKRFILASSIAAVGCLDAGFVPVQIPIPDDHPCLAREAYGLSKGMLEQLIAYFARTNPAVSFMQFRIGAVSPPGWIDKPRKAGSFTWGPFADLSRVIDADVIDGLVVALSATPKPGAHVYNLVGPDAACDDPVPEVVRVLPGEPAKVDTSWYAAPGRGFDSIFDMRKIKAELGFVPKHSVHK